jgi:hypothetical protein
MCSGRWHFLHSFNDLSYVSAAAASSSSTGNRPPTVTTGADTTATITEHDHDLLPIVL